MKRAVGGCKRFACCGGFVFAAASVAFAAGVAPRVDCAAMKDHPVQAEAISLATRGAVVQQATRHAAGDQPAEVEYCEMDGIIRPIDSNAPPIRFRLTIPSEWNGRAWHIGGGGNNGIVPQTANARLPLMPPHSPSLVAQGYAVYGSDSGHQAPPPPARRTEQASAGPPDPHLYDWILNEEAWRNFAYEQLKKTHDVAIALMNDMYGSGPKVSYFQGGSQGGREALEVLTRYPQDYDGICSRVPLAYFGGLMINPTLLGVAQLKPGSWIPPAKVPAIRKEILRVCDSLDGVADGVIGNYVACQRMLDAETTKHPLSGLRCADGQDSGNDCLSDAQLATLTQFHSSIRFPYALANGEKDWPGWGAGAEVADGTWLNTATQPDLAHPDQFSAGRGEANVKGRLGFSQDFNLLTTDTVKYQKQIQAISDQLDVREDWSAFFKRGGKLIMITGASDYVSNPRAQMRLYDRVVKHNGQAAVDGAVRYYVMPNAGHGLTGTAADGWALPGIWDTEKALVDWVEKGVTPPDAAVLTGNGGESRLMCRYPQYPKYYGEGADVKKAQSFFCSAP